MVTAEYRREQRARNPEAYREYARRKYQRNKEQLAAKVHAREARAYSVVAWLKELPCMDCGGAFPPPCMDFDHRPGTIKLFSIANAMRHSLVAIQDELTKCDLVCANCHRLRTKSRKAVH